LKKSFEPPSNRRKHQIRMRRVVLALRQRLFCKWLVGYGSGCFHQTIRPNGANRLLTNAFKHAFPRSGRAASSPFAACVDGISLLEDATWPVPAGALILQSLRKNVATRIQGRDCSRNRTQTAGLEPHAIFDNQPSLLECPYACGEAKISMARIRVDSRKSVRPFKGIICDDVSEFESHMPSQPVRSPPLLAGGPPKSAQIGPIRRIRLSLRVPDRATKASFRLSVSEGHFWCLVFGRCGCSVKNSNERSRPPLSG
jgi:hypothetical protein